MERSSYKLLGFLQDAIENEHAVDDVVDVDVVDVDDVVVEGVGDDEGADDDGGGGDDDELKMGRLDWYSMKTSSLSPSTMSTTT